MDETAANRAKLTFSLAWTFVLFNYVYADIGMAFQILSRPPLLARFQSSVVGSMQLTDAFFLGGAMLMEIAIAMVLLSWVLRPKNCRRANIAVGILFTAVILLTLFGAMRVPPLNYYTFFEVVEISATSLIAWRAWRWNVPAQNPSIPSLPNGD